MADNNNGYWPADNGGQPEQPQNDNLQQDAPTTSDAQDQQFAQEPLGAPQEAPAQNDDAQQPQPEAQDTRPTQPLAPVAPTSEQAQASEPTQPLPPQPTQPLYRPAPEYGAYGPTPTQPEPQQPQPTQQQNQNTGNGGNPFFNGNPFMTRPTDDASQQNRQNGNTPYGFPFGPQGPNGGQDQGMAQPEDGGNASRGGSSAASHIVTAVVAALVAAALCLGVGYFALTYGWVSTPTTTSLTNVQSNKSGTGSATAKTGEAADWKTVASEVSGSVVSIQAALSNGTAKGSGAIVSAKGYIVTNNHVISGAQQIQVTLSNGQMYTAQVVGTDTTTDLAVIKLDNPPSDLKAVEFADSDKLAVGEDVMAIGNPLGYDDTATTGIVSALNRPVTVTDDSGSDIVTNAVQIDAAINPGNSGGPTFNAAGQVIGINSSIASTATSSDSAGSIGIGFAIPSNLVKRVANEIIKHHRHGRGGRRDPRRRQGHRGNLRLRRGVRQPRRQGRPEGGRRHRGVRRQRGEQHVFAARLCTCVGAQRQGDVDHRARRQDHGRRGDARQGGVRGERLRQLELEQQPEQPEQPEWQRPER